MDSIDVVTIDHIHDHAQRAGAGFGMGGITPNQRTITLRNVRGGTGDVVSRCLLGRTRKRAERIEPGVDLDPPGMCFLDAERQRVITRRTAHRTRQPGTPRFERRLIDRITMRPNLKYHGIHLQCGHFVEHGPEFGLLGSRAESLRTRPINVVNSGDPRTPELTGKLGRLFAGRHIRLGHHTANECANNGCNA
jgi:hypothetical protein